MCVKLLFDQNLSYKLVERLKDIYPDSIHIASINLDQASDIKVWEYAKENGYALVTKDSDFNEICTLYNFPPHIIWLRLGNSKITPIQEVLTQYQKKICTIIKENSTGIIELNPPTV